MEYLKAIVNGCLSILQHNIDIFGYNITLFGVIIFSIIGYILICFWFRVMK